MTVKSRLLYATELRGHGAGGGLEPHIRYVTPTLYQIKLRLHGTLDRTRTYNKPWVEARCSFQLSYEGI